MPCEICGKPANTWDGIVGMILCPSSECLNVAWARAFPDLTPTTQAPHEAPATPEEA